MSVRAVILVGGEGMRLRPLTYQTPKPLVPVIAIPLLEHIVRHLAKYGIHDITFAGTAGEEKIRAAFGDGASLDVQLSYVPEAVPLGSGGAIANVTAGWDEPFLVMNGDIITDLDIDQFLAFHRSHRAEVSLLLSAVDDPSAYGVVAQDVVGRITEFVEKPRLEKAPSSWINGGVWLFSHPPFGKTQNNRFNRVEDTLFPALASSHRPIFGYRDHGYWFDVGTLAAYRQVNMDAASGVGPSAYLATRPHNGLLQTGTVVDSTAVVEGSVSIGRGSLICKGVTVHGPTVIGHDCMVDSGAKITESVLWDDVTVGRHARIERSVIASKVVIGAYTHLCDMVVAPGPQGATELYWSGLGGDQTPEIYPPQKSS